jgi:hypothetical protein
VTEGFGLDNLPYGAMARSGGPAQLAVRVAPRVGFKRRILELNSQTMRAGAFVGVKRTRLRTL